MKKTKNSIAFIFFLLSLFLTYGQQQNSTVEKLGLDPSEIKTIPSPNPDKVQSLIFSTFRGIPRFGLTNDIRQQNLQPNESRDMKTARMEFFQRIRESEANWRMLNTINFYKNTIVLEDWKKLYNPTDNVSNHERTVNYKNSAPYWISLFRSLAAATLTAEGYKEYFCMADKPCLLAEISNPNDRKHYSRKSEPWGGTGSSEFEKRRKVLAFAEEMAPIYIKWAEQFELKEAYMVGKVNIGEYDFKAQGFPLLRMTPVTMGYLLMIDHDNEDTNSLFKLDYKSSPNSPATGILLKMPVEKAEAFLEDVKKKSPSGRGKQLYYVYKVDIKLKEKNNTKIDYGFTRPDFKYKQVPANRTIEFFTDLELKNKVYEISR